MSVNNNKQLMYARLYYVLWYIIAGGALSIIPLYIEEINFTEAQVGIFLAVPSFTMLLQPIWGAISDRFNIPRLIVMLGIIVSGIFLSFIPIAANVFEGKQQMLFLSVTFIYIVASLFRTPVINTTDNIIFTMATKRKYQFGKLRMFGSFSWGGAMLILTPLITLYETESFFWFTLVGSFVTAYFVYKLPNSTSLKGKTDKKINVSEEFVKLFKNQNYVLLLIFTIFFSVLMPINIPYTSMYVAELTNESGITFLIANSTFFVALIVFMSTLPEMFMMVKYEKLCKKMGVMSVLILSVSFMLLKYIIFAVSSNIFVILVFSLLHGCAMGLYTPVIIKSIKSMVGDNISVFAIMMIGFFNAIAGILSSIYAGSLRASYGFTGVFYYCAIMLVICLVWLLLTYKKQNEFFKRI